MRNATILVTLLFTILLANAQEKRNVNGFTKLNVKGPFDIKLVTSGDLLIKSNDAEIVKDVKTEVKNGVLSIYLEDKKKYRNFEMTIEVPFKDLEEVILSGSGSIKSDAVISSADFTLKLTGSGEIDLELNTNAVNASLSGSGDIKLKGKTTSFTSVMSGSGDLEAFGLASQNTEVSISGSGDAQVYATESLKARVSGSGDISYRGNPKKEDTKVAGSGSIAKD